MVDLADVEAAARRLQGRVRRTPLLSSPLLDRLAGRAILVKAECLQHTGSFKFRGGWSAVSALAEARPPGRTGAGAGPGALAGVMAFSSGNHAQGVALAARMHGMGCVILMPADAPAVKIANTRAHGAEVITYDRRTTDRDALGAEIAAERGLALIRPFDDAQVIAGQASVGLEIAAQAREAGFDPARVLVPCGGGGLTGGIALALSRAAPEMQVQPVEPEGFDDVARSLLAGRRELNAGATGSLCDAILTPGPGALTLPLMLRHCGPGLVVSDDEALRAMALAFEHLRIVLEPGGAVALAAALFRDLSPGPVIAVGSGGNVDPAVFARALAAG